MADLHPFQWLVYQQDYLWFLVALGWGAAAVAWWRFARPQNRFRWVPWAAVAGVLTAGLEISHLITPVELQPGAAPWLAWDLALGCIAAGLAAGLWWTACTNSPYRSQRLIGLAAVALLVAAGPLRYAWPASGSWAIAMATMLAAILLGRRSTGSRRETAALFGLVASVWCSTTGPLAEWLREPHRFAEFSFLGPWSAGLQLATISMLAAAVRASLAIGGESPQADAAWRLFRRSLAVWLAAGMLIASLMGHWARANFERDLLSRVRLAANLIDKRVLETGLDERFHLVNIRTFKQENGQESFEASSTHLSTGVLLPIARALSDIELANKDAYWATVITLRDGWLVACCTSTRMPGKIADVGLYRRVLPDDIVEWSKKRPSVNGPVHFYYGSVVQARAPLFDRAGRMRGWLALDFNPARWLAAQVQARLLAFALIVSGGILLLVETLRRQKAEQREIALRQAEAAQQASQLKSAFLANVSHELRTPIQSLLGYGELLRDRVAGDPKASAWLTALNQHGETMTRLVHDLIDLSAIEAGAFQLSEKPTAIAEVVSQTVESLRPRAESNGLHLACFIDATIPRWLQTDGERVRQVLSNLVSNAIKFTERGGVTVALNGARTESSGRHRVTLAVRDTGPGIAPADQRQLFTPFARLPQHRDKEGSGLGLALSAALCRAMGGRLTVESDGATGSVFTATLLLASASPPAAEAVRPIIRSRLRGRRLLVVDDNPFVRELFVTFLTENGALCAAAATGKDAVAQAARNDFDAIVLDLALPDGDSTGLISSLRIPQHPSRIIGVSAHAGTADRARALAAGMDVFLTKPVRLEALTAAILKDSEDSVSIDLKSMDALQRKLLLQFFRELPAEKARLAAAISQSSWDRIQTLAHHLKNTAIVVHDDALFDACTGLEEAASAADSEKVTRWWGRCEALVQRWLDAPPA